MEFDNTNRGVLFENDKDGNEKRPDYTGNIDVGGKKFSLSAWKKTSKGGKPFLSLSISDFKPNSNNNGSNNQNNPVVNNDDIPF